MSALGTGLTIGASVTLIGAVVAFSLVRNLQSAPAADAAPDAGAGSVVARGAGAGPRSALTPPGASH